MPVMRSMSVMRMKAQPSKQTAVLFVMQNSLFIDGILECFSCLENRDPGRRVGDRCARLRILSGSFSTPTGLKITETDKLYLIACNKYLFDLCDGCVYDICCVFLACARSFCNCSNKFSFVHIRTAKKNFIVYCYIINEIVIFSTAGFEVTVQKFFDQKVKLRPFGVDEENGIWYTVIG